MTSFRDKRFYKGTDLKAVGSGKNNETLRYLQVRVIFPKKEIGIYNFHSLERKRKKLSLELNVYFLLFHICAF